MVGRFVGIMDKQHEKHQEKYGWVENKANEAAVMLIEATKKDETGTNLLYIRIFLWMEWDCQLLVVHLLPFS